MEGSYVYHSDMEDMYFKGKQGEGKRKKEKVVTSGKEGEEKRHREFC